MNKLKKSLLVVMVAMLSACASAEFPQIEEKAPVARQTVDGRKIKYVPRASNSLRADVSNAAYEDEDKVDTGLEVKDLIEADETEDKVEAAEVVEVIKSDDIIDEEKPKFEEVEKTASLVHDEIITAEESEPSVTYRLDTFYFDNGSSELSSEYRNRVREIVKQAKKSNATIKVLGYASSRTRNTDIVSHKLANFDVSLKRAQSVAKALSRAGLSAEVIEVEALSDSMPAYVEVMPEGERLNRRAEVYISY